MASHTSMILFEELNKCNKDHELLTFIDTYENKQRSWQNYIRECLFDLELSYEKFGKMCGFSKNTVKSWCVQGIFPRSREQFIKLGFGMKMNEEEINRLLQNYGGYSALYAKDVYDAICIYVLQQHQKYPEDPSYQYAAIPEYQKLYAQLLNGHEFDQEYRERETTAAMHEALLTMENQKDFNDFMKTHLHIFRGTHSKLIEYMESYIQMRGKGHYEEEDQRSIHQLAQRFIKPQGFEVAYSKLKRHGILPERNMLIDFGVGMTMTLAEINHLLELAQMRNLDVRNRYECIMIYLFNKHERNNPMLSLDNAYALKEVSNDPEVIRQCDEIIEYFYQLDEEGMLEEEGDDEKSLRTMYEEYQDLYGK
ncbi:MAG: hypothetical protein MR965_07855 [Lachnospiraceae bacterium]|nr:hypothetical protein [Lachnospiraceae bacterium]